MPRLSVPLVTQQSTLAKRWRDKHPTADPLRLTIGERRASTLARAAYWHATRNLLGAESEPAPGICDSCGRATHSWCEGCYIRTSGFAAAKFAAVCNPCDKEQFVCHNCQSLGISWKEGHAKYLQEHATEEEDPETIEVTDPETGAVRRITFQQLAERLGRPAEAIKAEIVGALGGTSSSS